MKQKNYLGSFVLLLLILISVPHVFGITDSIPEGETKEYNINNKNYEIKCRLGVEGESPTAYLINGGLYMFTQGETKNFEDGAYMRNLGFEDGSCQFEFGISKESEEVDESCDECSDEGEKWCQGNYIFTCKKVGNCLQEVFYQQCQPFQYCEDAKCITPPGCNYNNPPCSDGYKCKDNECVYNKNCEDDCDTLGLTCHSSSEFHTFECRIDSMGCKELVRAEYCGIDGRCENGKCIILEPEELIGCQWGNPECGPNEKCEQNECVYDPNIKVECYTETIGHTNYCNEICKCGINQGDCDSDNECTYGNYCQLTTGRIINDNQDAINIYDKCRKKEVANNPNAVPLVMIHGHSPLHDKPVTLLTKVVNIIKKLDSTEEALYIFWRYGYFEQFWDFIDKLEDDKLYLNKGGILGISSQDNVYNCEQGSWNNNIAIRTTYYLKDQGSFGSLVQMSDEVGIEEYAKRFSEVIKDIKKCTGSNKVDIIAHSMGGLVARQYIKDGGANSVNKLIMVGTPNKGVDSESKIMDYCKIEHPGQECNDMLNNSKFIRDLNSDIPPSNVKIYTIAGTSNGDDDGVVSVKSVRLNYAKENYEVDCNHRALIEPEDCPEAYEIVKNILQGKEVKTSSGVEQITGKATSEEDEEKEIVFNNIVKNTFNKIGSWFISLFT